MELIVETKVVVVAKNPTSGDKEFFEFGVVVDNGSDVFHTEYGNVRTGTQLIIPNYTPVTNEVKINVESGTNQPNRKCQDYHFVNERN